MQLHVIACFVVCCSLVSITQSVIQYKVRGPPGPQRLAHHTHPPHYHSKSKWPMPPRPPTRPHVRPIPVHMASYKVPVFARPPKIQQVQPAPLIFPSAVWKTPTAVYRPPVEKPFLTSPPVTQQYEFHLNKEPVINIPTIKQIGEKGPIHTIPAPNLSPADKPNVIFEEQAQKHTYQYTKEPEISPNAISPASHSNVFATNSLLGAQALPLIQQHQYQVTENAEPADQLVHPQSPFTAQKTYYAPDPDPNNLLQKLTQYTDTSALNNVNLFSSDIYAAPQQHTNVQLSSQATNLPLSAQELYQLLNGIPQQQLVDSYGMSVMQQPLQQQPLQQQHFQQQHLQQQHLQQQHLQQQHLQQQHLQQHYIQQPQGHPTQNYQTLLNSPQLVQAEQAYYNQIPDTESQQIKDNFKPQYQTFNYEEQSSHNAPRKEFAQSRVTADYNIEPEVAETYPKASVQSPHEALAQTQYVQQYFATREDNNVADNELRPEQEGSTKASQILNQLSAKNEISPSMFYSSLPNREAAETLATLQAAGSINSNILKLKQQPKPEENNNANHRDSMRIFVPDEEDNYEDMESQASGENMDTSKAENSHSQGIRIFETTHLQNANSRSDDSVEYEDYSGEESSSSETEKVQDSTQFGNKIKSKSTR